jgi:hypothetical protein
MPKIGSTLSLCIWLCMCMGMSTGLCPGGLLPANKVDVVFLLPHTQAAAPETQAGLAFFAKSLCREHAYLQAKVALAAMQPKGARIVFGLQPACQALPSLSAARDGALAESITPGDFVEALTSIFPSKRPTGDAPPQVLDFEKHSEVVVIAAAPLARLADADIDALITLAAARVSLHLFLDASSADHVLQYGSPLYANTYTDGSHFNKAFTLKTLLRADQGDTLQAHYLSKGAMCVCVCVCVRACVCVCVCRGSVSECVSA